MKNSIVCMRVNRAAKQVLLTVGGDDINMQGIYDHPTRYGIQTTVPLSCYRETS